MKQTRDHTIAPGGILGRLPVAEAVLVSFKGNAGVIKTAPMQSNASDTEFVAIKRKPIDGILSVCCESQIGDSIVVSNHVDVVDLVWGPIAIDPTPSNTVSLTNAIEDYKHDVAFVSPQVLLAGRQLGAGYFTGILSIPPGVPTPSLRFSDLPNEDAGFGIVIQEAANVRRVDLRFFHSAVPHVFTPHCVTGYYSQGGSTQRPFDV